jgi:hypothetical protein
VAFGAPATIVLPDTPALVPNWFVRRAVRGNEFGTKLLSRPPPTSRFSKDVNSALKLVGTDGRAWRSGYNCLPVLADCNRRQSEIVGNLQLGRLRHVYPTLNRSGEHIEFAWITKSADPGCHDFRTRAVVESLSS